LTPRLYRHHGLVLSCNTTLPRLTPALTGDPDLSIIALEPGEAPRAELPWAKIAGSSWGWRAAGADGTLLRLRYALADEWAEFVVDEQGRRVWVGWSENVLLAEVAELLLGPVFSCVLAQRGLIALHASVVSSEGRTVALVGPSGAGKSSLALALLERGAVLVSDDVAVLGEQAGRFTVSAGAPRIRVRPDSARVLVGSYAELEPMWVHEPRRPEKRYVDCSTSSAGRETAYPLDLICLLATPSSACEEPELRPLRTTATLPTLMANRHMVDLLEDRSHRAAFTLLLRLAETVPVMALARPAGIDTIHEVAATIESHLQRPA
jgi:hypothetical protein